MSDGMQPQKGRMKPFRLCLDVVHGYCVHALVCTTLWQSREGLRIIYSQHFDWYDGPTWPWWLNLLAKLRLVSIHTDDVNAAQLWLVGDVYG